MEGRYYDVCPFCGAHLDPGENCDCKNSDKYVSIHMAARQVPRINIVWPVEDWTAYDRRHRLQEKRQMTFRCTFFYLRCPGREVIYNKQKNRERRIWGDCRMHFNQLYERFCRRRLYGKQYQQD